jgi:hypothetical protein
MNEARVRLRPGPRARLLRAYVTIRRGILRAPLTRVFGSDILAAAGSELTPRLVSSRRSSTPTILLVARTMRGD